MHANRISNFVDKLAGKAEQIEASCRWTDPKHSKRRLALVVLVSPGIVDPLLHRRVDAKRNVPEDQYRFASCHVTDFLDLVQFCKDTGKPLSAAFEDWMDGDFRGAAFGLLAL